MMGQRFRSPLAWICVPIGKMRTLAWESWPPVPSLDHWDSGRWNCWARTQSLARPIVTSHYISSNSISSPACSLCSWNSCLESFLLHYCAYLEAHFPQEASLLDLANAFVFLPALPTCFLPCQGYLHRFCAIGPASNQLHPIFPGIGPWTGARKYITWTLSSFILILQVLSTWGVF